ncbi:Lrp/AsnC family transcriptional regulator [Marinomonas hwangdonensis]|uniref:Lrp/AsnC family transcriptional regulator n=1 Tax=Marinomonas hwangdonensis TaxID=1053647 RepID=A0A3M8Q128_9GAMM|nr:Lrp/AsnC family transcriptional regulator [Marinomonas hwangdonensis]MDP5056490.1 Lrp/AsnC family transcriptional regulator [Marinomonas hwangdonensis]RNF48690.1 Lrp/AsnC family transcriptional regulator [Marinomonas hwangdonensis]
MDNTDIQILTLLQDNGRLSNVELAEQIHLSASPCLRRVKQLETLGVIKSYKASLERTKVGLSMTVFIEVRLNNHTGDASDAFEQSVASLPNVISAYLVSGYADYRLEIVSRDLVDYEGILKTIQSLPYVKDIHSNFAIRAIKSDAPLPLKKS